MPNYKVVFSDLAIADLNDIVQYITEKESYTRAKYVERELLRTAKSLTTFPSTCQPRSDPAKDSVL